VSPLSLYGLRVESELALPGIQGGPGSTEPAPGAPTVAVRLAGRDAVRRRLDPAREALVGFSTGDGPVRMLRDRHGALLLDGGEVGTFALSATGDSVLCAGADPAAPRFQRMLLDTVLGTAALQAGLEGIHAAAVTIGDRLVAIAADTGAGKSRLAAEAIRRGASLFTDDLLFLRAGPDGGLLAQPGPAVMNLPSECEPIGRSLALIGTERWVELDRAQPSPQAVALVVIIDRRPGGGPPSLSRDDAPATLLTLALDSGPAPERAQARLDMLAALARSAAIVRLSAGTDVPPAALAEVVEAAAR